MARHQAARRLFQLRHRSFSKTTPAIGLNVIMNDSFLQKKIFRRKNNSPQAPSFLPPRRWSLPNGEMVRPALRACEEMISIKILRGGEAAEAINNSRLCERSRRGAKQSLSFTDDDQVFLEWN